jgi:hypothetical protein
MCDKMDHTLALFLHCRWRIRFSLPRHDDEQEIGAKQECTRRKEAAMTTPMMPLLPPTADVESDWLLT